MFTRFRSSLRSTVRIHHSVLDRRNQALGTKASKPASSSTPGKKLRRCGGDCDGARKKLSSAEAAVRQTAPMSANYLRIDSLVRVKMTLPLFTPRTAQPPPPAALASHRARSQVTSASNLESSRRRAHPFPPPRSLLLIGPLPPLPASTSLQSPQLSFHV